DVLALGGEQLLLPGIDDRIDEGQLELLPLLLLGPAGLGTERLLALVLHLVTKAAQLLPVALHLLGVGLVPLVEVLLALGILAIPGRELLGGGLGQLRRGDLSLLAVFGLLLDRR